MNEDLSPDSYKQLINHSVDILTVLGESGKIKYESPSVTEILGYGPEELNGENVFDYIHPDDQQKASDSFYEMVNKDSNYTSDAFDIRFQHKNGSWVWIEVRGSNKMIEEIEGYLITSRDISNRKESELELEKERERLDRFASVVSHDLRNPLNVLEGRVELAREECESEHFEDIENSITRMNNLIDDLLILTREGNNNSSLDDVEIKRVVEECWGNVNTKKATANIQTDQTIIADDSQVKRMFENFLRNSVEHGGEDVKITVGSLENGFYIEDNGQGISEDLVDSVIEAGFSTKTEGTGFGLNIVYEIINNHDWNLTIKESSEGGARFEITEVQLDQSN
jgi:PAS domain S-box-containing protein